LAICLAFILSFFRVISNLMYILHIVLRNVNLVLL
jgi:hypothetical protein